MIHVLHIRKTGGSAVADALEPFVRSHGLVLHPHATRLADVPKGDTVVLTVRDPLSRFVSGFNSRLRQGRPRNDIPWTPQEATAFARFKTPDDLAMTLETENPEFRHAAAAMQAIPHLMSLSFWLGSVEEIEARADDLVILSQPALNADFALLKALLDITGAQLPSDDVRAHRTPPGFRTDLSDRARENLRHFYALDLDLYARCMRRIGLRLWSPEAPPTDCAN